MTSFNIRIALALVLGLLLVSGCNSTAGLPEPSQTNIIERRETETPIPASSTPTLTPTVPLRQLTVCLGNEPASLFPYMPDGQAAKAVLAAIYDGPFEPDENLNNIVPIIVEKYPTLENKAMRLEPVTVMPGERLVNSRGELVTLSEGVAYRPAGCTQQTCELVYAGNGPVQMNQWVLDYTLLPGLTWSDGVPLTANDSLYGYEVAQALFPLVHSDLLSRTASYILLDERTVEWRGLPGYQDGDAVGKFFVPLPRHAWGSTPMSELPKSEAAERNPLGWGAYRLSAWQAGEQIVLDRNPHYFRAGMDRPYYDRIVMRFISQSMQSVAALNSGECDVIDPITGELPNGVQVFRQSTGWMLLLFGIQPAEASRTNPFTNPAVRQAAAQCIDRAAVAQEVGAELAEAYIPTSSPYFNPQAVLPAHDPAAGQALLANAGWVDVDNDPATPRTAQGAAGFTLGSPLVIRLLVSPDPMLQEAANIIQQGLEGCGMQVELDTRPAAEYLAAGPSGPVFGRSFDLALFAWQATDTPPCGLLLSREIPGYYPAFLKGWGGANAAGYANPEFDRACSSALTSLPGDPTALQDYALAQQLLVQDLPLLPLFWQERVVVAAADICGLEVSNRLAWWNIDEASACSP